ncbi:helix-turn-helix domain-containing protein [Lacinutrix sp. C3R15]|uniref:helix-turn-helix domain-containing protein n=1 Tax=Flavobacteriaceae TaxID=49546 RepID=UPI001C089F15|nr:MULTISPECIES: helix-turn-helix transcriptional regulator [Flavobacteriaceae]MBU2938642.1 helix-turn-helix domain-containing protein [Lacinutrix sp. C3R15]MDO6621956.1 helix-turn-helix transcriptional regulator [Oceanihabitans sp. 1_MG-2023]
MINTDAFSKRLQKIIDYYGESASSFAEKVGVQRSTISHILSGRNKPSLDFVMKVLSHFPEVELYWLMNGKGIFPNENKNETKVKEIEKVKKEVAIENKTLPSKKENEETPPLPSSAISSISSSDKKIERIVIFYSDGSFQNFEN